MGKASLATIISLLTARAVLQHRCASQSEARVHGTSLLQTSSSRLKQRPTDIGVQDWSSGWGTLNPATCVEVVLIEPRIQHAIAKAAASALANSETDLLTLAHGTLNVDYVKALVAMTPVLSEAWQQQRLRYLDLHVGDLGGDAVGSSNLPAATPNVLAQLNTTAGANAHTNDSHISGASYHDEYSRLMKSIEFWSQLACDRILIMQSDSLFCPDSTVRLSEFFGYGFVGGHAPHLDKAARIAMNGGFSFRNRPRILACLALYHDAVTTEDIFYSRCPLLEQPNVSMVDRFAIDNGYVFASEVPLGVHKPWVGPFSAHTMNICSGAKQLLWDQ